MDVSVAATDSPPGCPFEPAPRYDMNPPYGTALIINVQHFEGTTKEGVTLDLRRGSHIDFENLKQAWTQFGFNVVAHEDLKADEIRTVAQDTANKINKNSSSFVSVITTHGDRGKIYGSDSEYLEIKEVTDAFKTTKCPSLAGKPKLFIIVASGVRQNFTGHSMLAAVGLTNPTVTLATGSGDPNTPVAGVTTDAPARCEPAPMIGLTDAVKPNGDDDYDHMNDSIFREKLDPDEPHFLIAISLAPETVGCKSESDGTWSVCELVEIFKTHCAHEDISSMLFKVNENTSKAHEKKGYKQPCQLVFTTTKKVYLSSTARPDQVKNISQSAIDENDARNKTEKQEEKAQPLTRKPEWCYSMKKPYGVAVIINIKHFDEKLKFDNREGSDDDVENLERLWKELGFTVTMNVDSTTADKIYTFLKEVADKINANQDSSCFVCCIMTHGNMGKIYGSDSKSLDIKTITDLFKRDNCQALAGKPKLFFIQACRGSNQLRDHAKPDAEKEKGPKVAPREIPKTVDLAAAARDADYERKNNSDFLKRANPNEINFLIGYSTVPGYVSYRHVKDGAWYIYALCEIFRRHHKHEDVTSMMTRVNNKVQNQKHGESGVIQCPAPVATLTRKIYFD